MKNLNEKINKILKNEFKKKKFGLHLVLINNEEIFCAKAHIELKKKIKNLINNNYSKTYS